jgi:hypothetical protein
MVAHLNVLSMWSLHRELTNRLLYKSAKTVV